ncbi:hypothetical protein GXM_08833 [Nostoc sphaeroides CCNUC1]|uniref:Uncharacterized protein n=1 Tax=Nostoc sphaeroides CCNUC1 TaxID=2653204 RepID=A0A5P8WHN4_9NOSO|nr:hypothetical protein GXM_08833 [Nostoc sphaeroides CCNUC1]
MHSKCTALSQAIAIATFPLRIWRMSAIAPQVCNFSSKNFTGA